MKKCVKCGRMYDNHCNAQRYCEDCTPYFHKVGKQELRKRICKECGKQFESVYVQSQFCDKECARTWHNRNKAEQRKKDNLPLCIVCGELITDIAFRRYCSSECKKKGIKESHRRAYYNRRQKTTNKAVELSKIARLASEEGLTYGQYVSKYGL